MPWLCMQAILYLKFQFGHLIMGEGGDPCTCLTLISITREKMDVQGGPLGCSK